MSSLCVELSEKLASLNLDQYYDVITSNGFDTWETVQLMTEADMEKLGLKRGCRRKLLRAIATDQGYPVSTPLIDSNISKDFPIASSEPIGQRLGLSQGPPPKRRCQYPSEIKRISPTVLQVEHPIFLNHSDPVLGMY
jgi:hypothetical protein